MITVKMQKLDLASHISDAFFSSSTFHKNNFTAMTEVSLSEIAHSQIIVHLFPNSTVVLNRVETSA